MTDTVNVCYTFIYLVCYFKNTHTAEASEWLLFLLSVINSHTERNKMEKYVCFFFQNINTSY